MLFAVIRHDNPDSFGLRFSERPKHLEYLDDVIERIVSGGSLIDTQGRQVGSVLIIDVEDESAANEFAAADPYVKAGLFASTSIKMFRPVFKEGAWL